MRDFPIDELQVGFVNRLRAIRATFSPAVKLVEADEYWNIPTTAAKLGERMPAIIVTLDEADMDRRGEADSPLEWRPRFKANYLYPLDTDNRGQMNGAARKIVESFSASQDFDDLTEITAALASYTYVSLAEVVPSGMRPVDRLVDLNIGWVEVDLTAVLISENH